MAPRPSGRPVVSGSRPYQPLSRDIEQPIAPPTDADQRDELWSAMNWRRSLKELCDPNPEVVKRGLRRIHLRWYHASTPAMIRLLEMIGCPESTLSMIEEVVDTSRICRTWTRRAPDTKIAVRLSIRFNRRMQVDLMFLRMRCNTYRRQNISVNPATYKPYSVAYGRRMHTLVCCC